MERFKSLSDQICYEPKHPQLTPLRAKADPESFYKPRPNNDKEVCCRKGFVNQL